MTRSRFSKAQWFRWLASAELERGSFADWLDDVVPAANWRQSPRNRLRVMGKIATHLNGHAPDYTPWRGKDRPRGWQSLAEQVDAGYDKWKPIGAVDATKAKPDKYWRGDPLPETCGAFAGWYEASINDAEIDAHIQLTLEHIEKYGENIAREAERQAEWPLRFKSDAVLTLAQKVVRDHERVHWKALRREMMFKRFWGPDLYRCDWCEKGFGWMEMHLHHKHYDTFGFEAESDVAVLCKGCHFAFHVEDRRLKAAALHLERKRLRERRLGVESDLVKPGGCDDASATEGRNSVGHTSQGKG